MTPRWSLAKQLRSKRELIFPKLLSRDLIRSIQEITRQRNAESQKEARVAPKMHELSWFEGDGVMGSVIRSTDSFGTAACFCELNLWIGKLLAAPALRRQELTLPRLLRGHSA